MASKIEVEQMLNIQTNMLQELFEKHYDCGCIKDDITTASNILHTCKYNIPAMILSLIAAKLEFNHCEKIGNWDAFKELVIKNQVIEDQQE